MYKILATLLFISFALFAADKDGVKEKDYRIFAKQVEAEGDYIYALGDVVVYSDDYVLNADRVVYNKKTKEIELFGNVHILGLDHKVINSKYLKLNLSNKNLVSSPFFFFDPETDVWINSFEAESEGNRYVTDHAIVSSCDVRDPDWKITFKEGYFDKNSSMVTIKHAVLYAGKVPVFYLPYFKFPTDKSRHTGLLRPSGGYEKEEGIYFRQPLYIVLSKSADLEFDPQIRTRRGKGIYVTYRFVDSPYSKGSIRLGTFKEKYEYYKKYNLKNKVHNGFEIDYENRKVFSSRWKDSRDALLVDITYLNDIDYLNLQESNKKKIFNKLVTSKINYFIEKGNDYFGAYVKYFIDTDKVSNKDTLQTLPSLQYHRSVQPFFMKNILYSVDLKAKNWYREEGVGAKQYEASLPLTLYFSLYEDYLNFSVSENLYFTYVDYDDTNELKNGSYFSNYHKFSLNTDLLKRFDSFIHNVNVDLDFIVPSAENKKGDFADFITLNKEKKSLNLKLSQYFYNNQGEDFLLHRLNQSYYFDDDVYKYGDLENEIRYKFSHILTFYNQIFYSHERKKIRKSQTTLDFDSKKYYFRIMHSYENYKNREESNYLIGKFNTKLPGKYNFFADIDYDINNGFTKGWRVGWTFRKRCWNYKLTYRQSVTPSLTSTGTKSITKRGVFLTLNLVPLGGIHYEFTKSSNLEDK
ncbi:MAG: LPS-assembly protein LptD [Epsilonproteobacteria bacterium]|nr:LPS-assembly protein LptD [Campylobacterota bacterium]